LKKPNHHVLATTLPIVTTFGAVTQNDPLYPVNR